MNFVVGGQPVPQPRVRVTRFGAYVPKDHKIHAYRQAVAAAAKIACPHPTDDPVEVTFWLTIARPKSHFNKSGIKKGAPLWPRGDWDNFAKGIQDAMTGIVWYDDDQVVDAHVYKRYGRTGETRIEVSGVELPTDV